MEEVNGVGDLRGRPRAFFALSVQVRRGGLSRTYVRRIAAVLVDGVVAVLITQRPRAAACASFLLKAFLRHHMLRPCRLLRRVAVLQGGGLVTGRSVDSGDGGKLLRPSLKDN